MLDLITERTEAARAWGATRSRPSRSAGHRCRHNLNYWQFGDYLGLGAGAHGKLSRSRTVSMRQVRWREPRTYMEQVPGRAGPSPTRHEVARAELPFEFMLNALRLREGFALALFNERCGLPSVGHRAGPGRIAEQRRLIERAPGRPAREWVRPTEPTASIS